MYQLPEAFTGLQANRRFVIGEITPKLNQDGTQQQKPNGALRWDKIPCDSHGHRLEWQNPENLLTYQQSQERHTALQATYPHRRFEPGYIFSQDDGYVFVDIDNCIVNGQYNELAQDVMRRFPGAAIEISSSGLGIHIIFRATSLVRTKCANAERSIEVYVGDKFMMFGHPNATGNCEIDHTANFRQFIDDYMLDRDTNTAGVGDLWNQWAVALAAPAHPHSTPIADDKALIEAMLRSKATPDETFAGDKSKAWRLWHGDRSGYASESEADAALVSILCWWTGNEAGRVERLLWLSESYRSKYDRADYLPRTILYARGKQTSFYNDQNSRSAENSTAATTGQVPAVGSLLGATHQQVVFDGLIHIAEENRILLPNGEVYKEEAFNSLSPYSNYSYLFNADGRVENKAFKAFTQSKLFQKPQVDRRCFRPEIPTQLFIQEKGKTFYNEYRPLHGARIAGNANPFTAHLQKMIPNDRDREIFTCYIAAIVQYMGKKFRWCCLLQGTEGNGKSFIAKCLRYCIGDEYYSTISARALNSDFNDWQYKKILVVMEEVYSLEGRFETGENLKDKITNDYPQINKKNVTPMSMRVCCNYLLNTNHKNALKVTSDARRFAVFFTAQQDLSDKLRDGMTKEYWDAIHHWLEQQHGFEIVHDYLATYPINPDFNPALGGDAPRTSSHQEAIEQSRGGIEQEVLEAVESGALGFRRGWISSAHYAVLLERMGLGTKITLNHRNRILESLGYVKHPALPNGRANNVIAIDNKKSYLYVKKESPLLLLSKSMEVVNKYIEDQS